MVSPIIAKFYSALIIFKIINKFKKLRNKLFYYFILFVLLLVNTELLTTIYLNNWKYL